MRFRLVVNGDAYEVETDGGVSVDGHPVAGEAAVNAEGITVRIGRKRYRILLTRSGSMVDGSPYRVEVRDLEEGAAVVRTGLRALAVERIEVHPPMPGRIVRVLVTAGDRVHRHSPLAVLEAMKMQNEIPAPVAGRVREVRVEVGQGVLASDVLFVLEAT